jgi:hypothetical protein
MKVELVIDELVLQGFDPRHRHTIGDAVEKELTRLARAHVKELGGRRPMDVARLDAPTFEMPAQAEPARAGARIADSVFSALRGSGS